MTTTLLAVDDSKTMRRVLEITFAGEAYKVVLADSSEDALAKAGSERPAVALVDARLGNESGYDVCQRIKGQSPGTRVLILSSKHQPYDRGRGTSAGVDDFIDKPFDTQQLIDKVAALARKALEAGPPAQHAAEGAPPAAASPYRSVPQHQVAAPAVTPGARPRAPTLAYGTQQQQPSPTPPVVHPVHAQPAAPPMGGMHLPREAPAPAAAPRPAVPSAVPAAVPAASGGNGQFTAKLSELGLSREQIEGVLALSREVIEQVVWEVVPQLAETMIQEEIRRLTNE